MVTEPTLTKNEFEDLVHQIASENGLLGADDFLGGGWERATAASPESYTLHAIQNAKPHQLLGRMDAARCTRAEALRFIRESTAQRWPRLRIAADRG